MTIICKKQLKTKWLADVLSLFQLKHTKDLLLTLGISVLAVGLAHMDSTLLTCTRKTRFLPFRVVGGYYMYMHPVCRQYAFSAHPPPPAHGNLICTLW